MRNILRSISYAGGLAPLVLAALTGTAVAADTTSLRIEVYGLMGMHVLTLHSSVDEAGDHYAITTDSATPGIAGLRVDLSTKAELRRRLGTPSPRPVSFRRDTRRNGEDRRDKVDYRPDGTVEGSSTPAPAEPVSPAAARGTVDNLTAYFLLERQIAQTADCALAGPVLHGRPRYDP